MCDGEVRNGDTCARCIREGRTPKRAQHAKASGAEKQKKTAEKLRDGECVLRVCGAGSGVSPERTPIAACAQELGGGSAADEAVRAADETVRAADGAVMAADGAVRAAVAGVRQKW